MKKESAEKPEVMAAQRKLLESRYDLKPKLDPEADDVPRQAAAASGRRPGCRRA